MSEAVAAFDALSEEFFSVWFRFHPDVALGAGIRGFERLLPPQSDDELSALGSWLESLILALEELDYAALDMTRRVDLQLMSGAARVEHFELLEQDWRHRDPLRFLPAGEIYRLTLKPPEDIRDTLVRLLAAMPEYLRLALAQLRSMAELIAPELASAAVQEAERGVCYLRELVGSSWLRRQCHGWSEVERLTDTACRALGAYGEALGGEIAGRAAGRLGCGGDHLRFLFRHRHFMELDSERARHLLTDLLAQGEEALAGVCGAMGLALAPNLAWQLLEDRVVPAGERLETCRGECERLARFLRGSELVGLPDVPLRISERLACPRPQRFGDDYLPDRTNRTGTFFPGSDSKGRGEPLVELRARCIDRTWGGAHLLAFAAGEEGWRLPRRLCAGAGPSGAWALYLRERLAETGYMEAEDRLLAMLQRRDAIRRALLDLDLHSGVLDGAGAAARLDGMRGTGPSDLVRIARHPGDTLAHVLGWQALVRARGLVLRRGEGDFAEREFHDRLLSHGRIPLPLTLRVELGDGLWREVAAPLGA